MQSKLLERAKDDLLWDAYQFAKSIEQADYSNSTAEAIKAHIQFAIKDFLLSNRIYLQCCENFLKGEKDAV